MNECDRLRSVAHGREVLAPGLDRPRHRHLEAYAIVVVAGAFDQVGYAGRVRVTAGDVLVQPVLDCHANRMPGGRGATIVRLPWSIVEPPDCIGDHGENDAIADARDRGGIGEHVVGDLGGVFALADVDAVARAAERDVHEAAALARATIVRRRPAANDLPDQLAADLARSSGDRLAANSARSSGDRLAANFARSAADRTLRIDAWAECAGVARETVARGFALAYGVSPRQFRGELRARRACLRIARTRESLAAIAAATGFCDQAHMTREVQRLLGMTPAAWRRDPRVAAMACGS